ncbi:transposase [Sulfobacillus acidophilus TPY]|nr:transposase [Sulfobacillus acidophilus TPY]
MTRVPKSGKVRVLGFTSNSRLRSAKTSSLLFFVRSFPAGNKKANFISCLWGRGNQVFAPDCLVGKPQSKDGPGATPWGRREDGVVPRQTLWDNPLKKRSKKCETLHHVILDWTDCHDGHQTLVAALVSRQGRAVPVFTQTVAKADLTLRQGAIERSFIQRLRPLFPPTCTPVLLADRGFCSASFLAAAHAAGWKWIIRLKGDRWIETPDYHGRLDEYATTRTRWGDWAAIRIGKAARQVWRLVATWAEGQQEPWFLVTNCGHLTADQIIRAYARRFQIEELFKDSKNGERGGFRLRGVRLTRADRWDRLWLIFTWALFSPLRKHDKSDLS